MKIAFASNGDQPGRRIHFWCPACASVHGIVIDRPDSWTWDGNEEAPTFNPSIAVGGTQWAVGESFHKPRHHVAAGERIVCHSFVRAGRIEYLGDCTHEMAGTTVDMVEWPYGTDAD